jgi:hypothetical protein
MYRNTHTLAAESLHKLPLRVYTMPKHKFELSIDGWHEIHKLPDSWPIIKLREVLALLEYEAEVSDDELAEVVLEARAWLNDHVAQGMETHATLNRLYKDELIGDAFPAANDILWCVSKIDADRYSIISSRHWMASLEDRINWTASAAPDRNVRQ